MLVTVSPLTLSVTFLINGTKKLQSAAKQKRETKERTREGVSACLQLRNLGAKRERVLKLGNCQRRRVPSGILSLPL